jgi:hypothetical protein
VLFCNLSWARDAKNAYFLCRLAEFDFSCTILLLHIPKQIEKDMTMKANIILVMLCCVAVLGGCDKSANKIPDFLTYNSDMIDPYCMGEFLIGDSSRFERQIVLADCTNEGRAKYNNEFTRNKDYFTQIMEAKDKEEWSGHMDYSYRFVAGDKDRFR